MPDVNPLYDHLFGRHAGSDVTFLHLPDEALSYSAFLARAAGFAHALSRLGLAPGDRVAVQLDKSAGMLAVYAACVQAGLVFLPLNTAYTPAEVDYFLGDSGARLFLTPTRAAGELGTLAARHGAAHGTLDSDGGGSLGDLARSQPRTFPTVPRARDDLAAILYTSGTTGRSKGAMLSQQNLLSNAETLAGLWRFSASDVLLHALPLFHTHGLFVATNVTLRAGGAMVLLPKFDLDALLGWMPRATALMGVPTFYTRLLADERFTAERASGMRLFVSGSAPLLAETHRAFEARTGHRILERYGMTETNMSCSNPYDGERRPGTVGPPLPGVEARVCDEAGTELARGETGVLEVRGPNVFRGYWQMPEKTAAELRPDGWFITGDLATMSDDGYVTIVGRAKDLVISGGLNVYPKEVEEALDALPGVGESAVIGVPHPDLGEAVVAVIAHGPGPAPDADALADALAGRLARFKQPRRYLFVEALPRNTMGKVQKAALRAEHAGLFAP
ncbi:malonyl-CoA synthase [Oceanicola granulosus HTCC2516]|uniref:Malonyl-CoA synthase n=1 Tax=Oceanicola granulosus (strain ATCC BAA-861 / DSM 15982 / KCTC 12143 / HTCC2516) TaxID=314256 RepID=Q2CCW1_OCEGH|nr:malonyl-CoA synthase [Oceanicola granulosus]EAR50512.1 malonyl-CoA synthase [Oceanicola granulosus HTCC2516]